MNNVNGVITGQVMSHASISDGDSMTLDWATRLPLYVHTIGSFPTIAEAKSAVEQHVLTLDLIVAPRRIMPEE